MRISCFKLDSMILFINMSLRVTVHDGCIQFPPI